MTPEQKLLRIVESARGDDLERARRAFGHMSDAELDQEHGDGQTRRQVLQEYENERALYLAAKALLIQKLNGAGR